MINMKSWVNQQIKSKTRIAIPIMTHPGIEMIGKTIKEAVQDGKIHALAIKKLVEIYPSAATTVIMDLSLEAEAFGSQIEFQENDMPHILGRLLNNSDDIYKLRVPELTTGRVPQYLLANKITVEQTKNKPVLAGVIGPFSLAGRLFNISELMMECYTDPKAVKCLLDKCTEFILKYCLELKRIGCSGVLIAEPAAGLLSNADCQTFSSDYIKLIVDSIQDENFLVILHNCGNHGHCTEAMLNTGANAYHFGNAIDMVTTLKSCPKDKLIMGNVDPTGVMKMKSAGEIKTYVGDLLNKTSSFKNYVLSTGCDMPPHVPAENIDAFFDALHEYNQKNKSISGLPIDNYHE
jgi:uroporphyrinogen decarboxylase